MKKLTLLFTIILTSVLSFAGDILTLNNGMVFEGKIIKIKDCDVTFKADGQKYVIPASDIFSLQFEDVNNRIYTQYLELSKDSQNKCLNGRLDAENYHGKKGAHFILGMLFGPFAMIGTALTNPTPEKGNDTYLRSNHKDQFNDAEYLSCYKKQAKKQMLGMDALGWGAWVLFIITIASV
jgi:hypothetical protein